MITQGNNVAFIYMYIYKIYIILRAISLEFMDPQEDQWWVNLRHKTNNLVWSFVFKNNNIVRFEILYAYMYMLILLLMIFDT